MTPGPGPEPGPEPDLRSIEDALRSLAPKRPAIDRDRVIYQAGRASARGRFRPIWPAIAAGLALVAGVEGALLAVRPATRVVERIVVVREPAGPPVIVVRAPAPPAARPVEVGLGSTDHDRLAGRLIRYGLDGMASPRSVGSGVRDADAGPSSSRRMLQDELLQSLRNGDPS